MKKRIKKLLPAAVFLAAAVLAAYALPRVADAPEAFYPQKREGITVLFMGDIMLDRNVARTAADEGAQTLFAGVLGLLQGTDLRVANLEGTITKNPSIAQRDNKILRFTFDPKTAYDALSPLRLDAVSLANNHALDFGELGYEETLANLSDPGTGIGALPFGHPFNDPAKLSTVLEHNGKTLCLVGYHSLFKADYSAVVSEIVRLRPECWRLVVFPHWGEEYVHTAGARQREAAHAFVDAGADLVVGAHPHVVQDTEVYRGKAIFYSLGNFMFDQNFSWATQHGAVLRVEFGLEDTHFTLIPTSIIEQKASITEGQDRQKTLDLLGVAEFTLP